MGGSTIAGNARTLVARARHQVGTIMGEQRLLAPLIVRKRARDNRGLMRITKATRLVVEGFPRSGNTFAVNAFRSAQGNPWIRMSHHIHAPVQVGVAVETGVPVVVLVRRPADAVLSYLLYLPYVTAERACRDWLSYYRRVEPYVDRVVLATFDEVITDMGAVIEAINRRFGTRYVPFEHTEANVAAAHDRGEQYQRQITPAEILDLRSPRPNAARDAHKAARRAEFERPAVRSLLAEAEALYERLVAARSPLAGA
jgi:hypothetical protein